jgi:hypothetical protein
MHGFIDPPTPFAPRKAWEDFLAQLSRLPQDDQDVQRERERAQQALKKAKD